MYFRYVVKGLFIFLRAEPAVGIGQTDRQLLCTFDDFLSLLRWNAVRDFAAVHTVLHQQHFQFLNVVHQEFLESGRQHMTGTFVWAITNVWHQVLALETTTDTVIDTLGLTPVWLFVGGKMHTISFFLGYVYVWGGLTTNTATTYCKLGISVRLMADETLCALLHNLRSVWWTNCHFFLPVNGQEK